MFLPFERGSIAECKFVVAEKASHRRGLSLAPGVTRRRWRRPIKPWWPTIRYRRTKLRTTNQGTLNRKRSTRVVEPEVKIIRLLEEAKFRTRSGRPLRFSRFSFPDEER